MARVVAVLQRFLMYWSQKQYSAVQHSTVQYLVAEAVLLLARREAPVDAAPGALAPLQAHRAAELRGALVTEACVHEGYLRGVAEVLARPLNVLDTHLYNS